MKALILNSFKKIDLQLTGFYKLLFEPKSYLIVLLFHSLFENQEEIDQNLIDPQQRITAKDFENIVLHFKNQGFNFTNPIDVENGLDPKKKHILLTFDDGYYNNRLALNIINKHKVATTFYISIRHLIQQKLFWWDVIYREEKKIGQSDNDISSKCNELKHHTNDVIEEMLISKYGDSSLSPLSDIDRPFTIAELKEFAKNEFVYIGNHTMDHAILTSYGIDSAKKQIIECQQELAKIIGYTPNSISYPNGNFNTDILDICREAGLKIGITGVTKQNKTTIASTNDQFKLGRFVPYSGKNLLKQCLLFQSSFSTYAIIKGLNKRLR